MAVFNGDASFKENVVLALRSVQSRLKTHGGGIELVRAEEDSGLVVVRFKGACAGCPFAVQTLEGLVERALEEVPGVTRVAALTDE